MSQIFSSDSLLSQVKQYGHEYGVEVNHRMLIDKILARYSSDFVVCRELIQNADDAKATSFFFEIFCEPNDPSSESFHNSVITEIRAVNNGATFTIDDWKRIASIAEGNTSIESVGQFGVGFFSVFSFAEEPIIASGKEYMAFTWRGDSLTTYRCALPENQQSDSTLVILKMRSKYVLDTQTTLKEQENGTLSQSTIINNALGSSKSNITPTLNLSQIKAFFTKVLTFTTHVNEIAIKMNDKIVFQVKKSRKHGVSLTREESTFNIELASNMFSLNSFTKTEQIFSITNGLSITLIHVNVEATVNIDQDFRQHIKRILKKDFPPIIRIQLLYIPNEIISKLQETTSDNTHPDNSILNSLLPIKYSNGQWIPSGLVFIGLGTHQTTGIGIHVFSHLVPTVERENLDMQDPYLKKWNEEILITMGYIIRFVYDQSTVSSAELNNNLFGQFTTFSFQPSVPNNKIGFSILNGFFSSRNDFVVPVKQNTSAKQLSWSPSSETFLANSKYIHSFLSLPLVPLELSNNGLFIELKRRKLIQDVNNDIIKRFVSKSVLLSSDFINLLFWLCENNSFIEKTFIKNLFSIIRFQDDDSSPIITLQNIQHYDGIKISSSLLLPSDTLPARIAAHISTDHLNTHLSLTALTLDELLNFYFHNDQKHILTDNNTIGYLFNLISKYWHDIQLRKQDEIKQILSEIECIPTQKGMKLPRESYIPSKILSPNLPLIHLNIVRNFDRQNDNKLRYNNSQLDNDEDNRVLSDFLRFIGCRTFHVQSFVDNQKRLSNVPQSIKENSLIFLRHMIRVCDTLSGEDIETLKKTQCLAGKTIQSNNEVDGLFCPNDLHFPCVADQIGSDTLRIIILHDNIDSRGYEFLRLLGVRDVPVIGTLVNMITDDFNNQRFEQGAASYIIPRSLTFLARHVETHYPELWKEKTEEQILLLPSQWPTDPYGDRKYHRIVLLPIEKIFKDYNPLSARPLQQVIDLFERRFNLSLLGLKDKPTLKVAFELLMERKTKILTSFESTSAVFAYMNGLEGMGTSLKEEICTLSFIPLRGSNDVRKSSEVFIGRSESSVNEIDTSGLIDYVDFGADGNSFLRNVGVQDKPTGSVLATLLLDRQASFFDDPNRTEKDKIHVYLKCLQQLNIITTTTVSKPLIARLQTEPWCLGFVYNDTDNIEQVFRIVAPKDIYLLDDPFTASYFHPLCPPITANLNDLYKKFGSRWLRDCIATTFSYKGVKGRTGQTNTLRNLIIERTDILIVDKRGTKMPNLNEKSFKLLQKNVEIFEVDAIDCELTFSGKKMMVNDYTTCVLESSEDGVVLHVIFRTPMEYIDVASAIAHFLNTEVTDDIILATKGKLEMSVKELERFGYSIARLHIDPLSQTDVEIIHQHEPLPSATDQSDEDIPDCSQRTARHGNNDEIYVNDQDDLQNTNETIEDTIVQLLRPYHNQELLTLNNSIQIQQLINNGPCAAPSNMDLHCYQDLFYNIPFYTEKNLRVTNSMVNRVKQLATILSGLATNVFNIPVAIMRIYRNTDNNSRRRSGFHRSNAFFLNLRYFESIYDSQMHLPGGNVGTHDPTMHYIVNFYFMTLCHLLVHNRHRDHNNKFIRTLEETLIKFLPAKDSFLELFKFSWNFQ